MMENQTQPYIHWTPEEWQAVAAALMTVSSDYAKSLPETVRSPDLRIAINVLPEERRRKVGTSGAGIFRNGLAKAYADILGSNKVEPKTKVFWREDEYLALARALHKLEPSGTYLASTTLAGLSPVALREAEKIALPSDRHRNLGTVSSVRPKLLDAFAKLKIILAQEKDALEEQRRFELEQAQAQATPAPPPQINPYEAAFKPFLDALADAVIARIAATYPPHNMPQPQAQPAQSSAPRLHEPQSTPFQPPHKPKIGVVGAMSVQGQDIQRAFPDFEIIHLQHTSVHIDTILSKLRSAVKVIGMTDFMRHGADGALLKHFGDNYTRVTGGVSSIKRQINIWIHQGALPA